MFGKELTLDGRKLLIIHPGVLNTDAGPDFNGARLMIGDTQWVGNIEIHVKASDWYRHNHDSDPSYDNIILHVVAIDDMRVKRTDGTIIPQVTVTFPEKFFHIYSLLADSINSVRCARFIPDIPNIVKVDWIETLVVERMQVKVERIRETVNQFNGDWEQACFVVLARAMGFGVNGVPFEMLARSLPLKYIRRHSDNLLQIEALIFGQAGMLDTSIHIFDEYYQLLCREYFFLARKYNLRPIRNNIWKYSRMRPNNFPHRRLAMLARALHNGFYLLSELLEHSGDIEYIRELFKWRLEGYWLCHSDFDIEGHGVGETLSNNSIDLLIINVAAPLIYAYSASRGEPENAEKGIDLWQELKPENNMFMRQWGALGIKTKDASHSQALLHLRREYCDMSRCLECRWGCYALKKTVSSHSKMLGDVAQQGI